MGIFCGNNGFVIGDRVKFSFTPKYLKCKTKKGPRKAVYRGVVGGNSTFTVTKVSDGEIEIYPAKR